MGLHEGQRVLVTGGARGIGRATARLFIREGASVVVADVLATEGEALVGQLGERAGFCELDVASERSWEGVVETVIERFGRIDVLVNNAGVNVRTPLVDFRLDDYRRVTDVNQTGVVLGMRAVLPHMLQAGGGSIVNLSSLAGLRGLRNSLAYSASKHAVIGMSRAAAVEVADSGVRVNVVCPGPTDTPFVEDAARDLGLNVGELSAKQTPMRRMADPAEVANVIAFLASDRASYCTGSVFVVDGGWSAGLGAIP